MSYTKQEFQSGDILFASQLNAMDNAIYANDANATKAAARITALEGKGVRPVIYCWGDSLTEGVGGYIMPPDGYNAYMAYSYPDWVGQTFDVVNLGARSEDVNAIMARQGADPVVIQTSFTIPASADTPVKVCDMTKIYDISQGVGLQSKSGKLIKWHREVESAGVNPCTIMGVEGILYREIVQGEYLSNDATYEIKFKRLVDGDETVVPVGTEVQTYAMRFYRDNGAAIIWMGANGGHSGVSDFINKVELMIEYGGYGDKYLIIISREFDGVYRSRDVGAIKQAFTDGNGICHVLDLMDHLPYRGYALAGVVYPGVDPSEWTGVTDTLKLTAPILCEYISGQTGAAAYGTLHYSIWGNKAIGKLVVEKLGEMGWNASSGGADRDDYGKFRYKLEEPKSLNGSNYINTKCRLYTDLTDSWTLVIKWSGIPEAYEAGWHYPCNIFNCTKDGSNKGLMYRYTDAQSASMLVGNTGMPIYQTEANNMVDHWGGTNVVIISKSGASYRLYVNSANPAFGGAQTWALSDGDEFSLPLIVGARWNGDGTGVNFLTAFTVEDLRVYDDALDDADCKSLYGELAGGV